MECDQTMESAINPGHTHTCSGQHDNGDHFCKACRTWWFTGPESPPRRRVRR